MPKKLLNRWMPSPEFIQKHKCLRCFGQLLHDPSLWILNRTTVSNAVAIGLFFAFIPLPFQMVMAAAGAIWLHGNLPVSIGLVWLTNPITMPPIFYAAYRVGAWVLNVPTTSFNFEPSIDWFVQGIQVVVPAFLLGSLLCAIFFSLLGYSFIRLIWRWRVVSRWRKRNI